MNPRAVVAALGVTLVVQAQAPVPPVTGFFSDPIVAFVLRIVSVVLSLALSGTIIIACIKMIAYFGAAGEAQRNLGEAVKTAKVEFHDFRSEIREWTEKVGAMLQIHNTDIAVLKTTQAEHERRLGERRQNPGRRDANHHDTQD